MKQTADATGRRHITKAGATAGAAEGGEEGGRRPAPAVRLPLVRIRPDRTWS